MLTVFLRERRAPYMVPVTGAGPDCSILGNALERGYGITPFADHFGAVLGIEAVLPDGRIYHSPLAELGAPEAARAFKWGIGPYLDGLFAQGGFGVVTRMTIALARRPEQVKAFLAGVKNDGDLDAVVKAVREVLRRFPGVVGGINLLNAHRVLAMAAPYPDRVGPDGLIPPEALQRFMRQYGLTPWTVFGTLYGSAKVVAAAQSEIRGLLKRATSRLMFVSPTLAARLGRLSRFLPARLRAGLGRKVQMLESSLELVSGVPNETALPLAYWRGGRRPPPGEPMDPDRDGCGLIWYAPLVVMKSGVVRRYVDFVTSTMRAHRLEPLVTLTSLSERCFDSSVPLLFDRSSQAETDRARACYFALLEEGAQQGFMPYRVGIDAMEWLTSKPGTFWELVAELKSAIDPQGIVAPGRYAPLYRRPDNAPG